MSGLLGDGAGHRTTMWLTGDVDSEFDSSTGLFGVGEKVPWVENQLFRAVF